MTKSSMPTARPSKARRALDLGHWAFPGHCVIGLWSFPQSWPKKICSMMPLGWRYISALNEDDMPVLHQRDGQSDAAGLLHLRGELRVDGRHVKGLGQFRRGRGGEGGMEEEEAQVEREEQPALKSHALMERGSAGRFNPIFGGKTSQPMHRAAPASPRRRNARAPTPATR